VSRIRSGKANPRMMHGSSIQSNSCVPPTCRCPGGGCLTRCCGKPVNPTWPVASYGGHGGGFQGPGGMAYTDIDCTSACASLGDGSGGYGPPTEGQFDHCWEQCTYYFGAHSGIM
tara:strand:+ start:414 stop:758 length:345 start_codon:yes stop_codon:yes gene_type:complete